jgi:hypothetical protein
MSAERKIARELDESMADDRAHRIASAAAEDLIRCEGEATSGIDEYAIPQCQADRRPEMNKEDAKRFWDESVDEQSRPGFDFAICFANRVAAHEREECAAIVESKTLRSRTIRAAINGFPVERCKIAEAVRNRSNGGAQ